MTIHKQQHQQQHKLPVDTNQISTSIYHISSGVDDLKIETVTGTNTDGNKISPTVKNENVECGMVDVLNKSIDEKGSSLMIEDKWKFNRHDLLHEEIGIRKSVMQSPGAQGQGGFVNVVGAAIVNMISAFLIFVLFLISLESLLSLAMCIALTVHSFNVSQEDPAINGNTMSWTLLTFAVVTPLSASIGMAFTRRENALFQIADFKATMINLFQAHTFWDWEKIGVASGRAASDVDWVKYTDDVLYAMIRICCELTRLLTLPNASRARHHVFPYGRKQRENVVAVSRKLHRSILEHMCFITEQCELLKREGLPPNEATRIRQWERFLSQEIEQMLVIKSYRTPQALRSFARLFTVFLPPFYAPYYGQLAVNLNSLWVGIVFSILTSIALTSLFESLSQMEDPYVGSRLDCIDIESELRDEFLVKLLDIRGHKFPKEDAFHRRGFTFPEKSKNDAPMIRLMQAY